MYEDDEDNLKRGIKIGLLLEAFIILMLLLSWHAVWYL